MLGDPHLGLSLGPGRSQLTFSYLGVTSAWWRLVSQAASGTWETMVPPHPVPEASGRIVLLSWAQPPSACDRLSPEERGLPPAQPVPIRARFPIPRSDKEHPSRPAFIPCLPEGERNENWSRSSERSAS